MGQVQISKNQMIGKSTMPVAPTQINPMMVIGNQQYGGNGYTPMMTQQNMYNQTVNPMMQNHMGMAGMPMTRTNPVMNPMMDRQNPMNPMGMATNPMMGNQMMNGYNSMNMYGQVNPMANQMNMYQNPMMNNRMPMASTNPMMGQQFEMNGYNGMMNQTSLYNNGMNMMNSMCQNSMMNQPNMNMMNGYNQYNNYGMQTPTNPMMGRPTMPLQMPGVNNYAYNNYGMPMNQTNQMANQYGMMPQQTTMMNQTPLYSGGMNDPTPVSKQELIKKVEKDLLLKKECKDFTFIVTRTNETYIFFKRRNKEWIKKFSGTLWNGCDIKIICEGDVVYIPLAVNSYEEFILDNELLIFLEKLRPNFFLKKLVKSDFIKINGQIICINSDNLLEKYEKYDHSYFFISSERNQLVQDFSNALTNDDYLFIDEKTKRRNTFDSLPRLKELENYFEEVKDYEK